MTKLLGAVVILSLTGFPAWGLDAPSITATAKGPNQINLTWAPVADPGYGYRIEIQSNGDSRYLSWTSLTFRNGRNYLPYWVTEDHYRDPLDATSGDGTACQYPVYGLKNNTTYNFRVRSYAKNDGGADTYSNYSATATATTSNYNVRYVSTTGSDSNNGQSTSSPWRHIYYACRQAVPGTVVYIMGGNYADDYVYITQNGTPTAKIVIQTHPGDSVAITGGDYNGHTGYITGSYVVIDGIKANYGQNNGENWIITGTRNAIVDCDFGSVPNAGYATLVKVTGTYNLIHNNYLHDSGSGANGNQSGTVCTLFGNSANRNVVQYNRLSRGAHDTGLVKNGASYNKWLNNLHDGGWGLGWECVSDSIAACQYNLFEGNEVAGVQQAGNGTVYKPGIEISGNYNTVRRNVIHSGYSHGIEVSYISGYGAHSNLIYNNTIYKNGGAGIAFFSGGSIAGNVVANNIFYYNGLRNPYDNAAIEVFSYPSTTISVKNNLILYKSSSGAENPAYACIDWGATGTPRTVAYANSNLSGFSGNITDTPGFINETGSDFHLKSSSKAINAGVVVTDNTWGTIAYRGAAPDLGAFEYSEAGTASGTVPSAPRNLRIITQ